MYPRSLSINYWEFIYFDLIDFLCDDAAAETHNIGDDDGGVFVHISLLDPESWSSSDEYGKFSLDVRHRTFGPMFMVSLSAKFNRLLVTDLSLFPFFGYSSSFVVNFGVNKLHWVVVNREHSYYGHFLRFTDRPRPYKHCSQHETTIKVTNKCKIRNFNVAMKTGWKLSRKESEVRGNSTWNAQFNTISPLPLNSWPLKPLI